MPKKKAIDELKPLTPEEVAEYRSMKQALDKFIEMRISNKELLLSVGYVMAFAAHESNAETLQIDIQGMTHKDYPIGDFRITVRRLKKKDKK